MNNSYYETLDKNFNEALSLLDGNYNHCELIDFLQNGNIPQRQFAALSLDKLENSSEAEILLNNLVGQDGKIREVVSLKIKEFAGNKIFKNYFLELDTEFVADYFLSALIDVNTNICRNILELLQYFKDNEKFITIYVKKLLLLIHDLCDKIDKFVEKDGKYKINKELFKLYWCLEAVYELYYKIPQEEIKRIVIRISNTKEYTIREKIAKILVCDTEDIELIKIKNEFENDSNYYVKNIFHKRK